jgi:proteasome lid subunit RPN8/RPN11
MIRRLVLASRHVTQLKKHASNSLPLESCALLVGRVDGEEAIVKEVIITANVDRSKVTFSIDPNELLKAYKKAEDLGLDIVGIFHSHPASAKPSGTDEKFMEINPVPWLIMSTLNNEMRAYLLDRSVKELEIKYADG